MPGSKCSKDMPGGEEQGAGSGPFRPAIALAPKKGYLCATRRYLFQEILCYAEADVSSLSGVINHEKIAAGVRLILEGLGGPGA